MENVALVTKNGMLLARRCSNGTWVMGRRGILKVKRKVPQSATGDLRTAGSSFPRFSPTAAESEKWEGSRWKVKR